MVRHGDRPLLAFLTTDPERETRRRWLQSMPARDGPSGNGYTEARATDRSGD